MALAYENHLVWVNLRFWRWMRDVAGHGISSEEGMVDLYFDRFGSASFGTEAEQEGRSAAQIRFEESVEAIAAPLKLTGYGWWDRKSRGRVCFLTTREPRSLCYLPHPVCADKLILRVEPCLSNLRHPLFAQFDALAQRIESRRGWEQLVLC